MIRRIFIIFTTFIILLSSCQTKSEYFPKSLIEELQLSKIEIETESVKSLIEFQRILDEISELDSIDTVLQSRSIKLDQLNMLKIDIINKIGSCKDHEEIVLLLHGFLNTKEFRTSISADFLMKDFSLQLENFENDRQHYSLVLAQNTASIMLERWYFDHLGEELSLFAWH